MLGKPADADLAPLSISVYGTTRRAGADFSRGRGDDPADRGQPIGTLFDGQLVIVGRRRDRTILKRGGLRSKRKTPIYN